MAPIILDLNIKIHLYHRSQVATSAYFNPRRTLNHNAASHLACAPMAWALTPGKSLSYWKILAFPTLHQEIHELLRREESTLRQHQPDPQGPQHVAICGKQL